MRAEIRRKELLERKLAGEVEEEEVEGQLGTEEALIDETEDAGGRGGATWVACWGGGVCGASQAEGGCRACLLNSTYSQQASFKSADWASHCPDVIEPCTSPPHTPAGFAKVEKRVRTAGGGSTGSVRNLRIREDTAKYLLNLDTNSGGLAG